MAIVPFADPTYKTVVGQHSNSEEWNAISRLADNVVSAPIGFGQPVARHSSSDQVCRQWTTGPVLGITRYRNDIDPVLGYKEGETVSIMTMGVMGVAAGGTATAGAQAGYNPATDRWADVGGSFVKVAGVEFDTTAASSAMVYIRINRPSTGS